jgi:DNA-3-methyladenine glycosylase
MLNVVTEREGFPAAVLIRAIQPLDGVRIMSARRHGRDTFGPGKLTQALSISQTENGLDLASPRSRLRIERGVDVPDSLVTKGPRVGLTRVPEPWRSKPWRLMVEGWRLEIGDSRSGWKTGEKEEEE